MLDLLYHKRNPSITTVVDGSIFEKIFKTITGGKNFRRYYFYLGITMIKLYHNLVFCSIYKIHEMFSAKICFVKTST